MLQHRRTRRGGKYGDLLPARHANDHQNSPAEVEDVCAALALWLLLFGGCAQERYSISAQMLTGGNVSRGEQLIYSYNCGSCHTIPGVAEANGILGPTLKGIADRVNVAGLLTNTPENLSRWIAEPEKVHPQTAMPNLGVTKGQAIDIAAYLYTLR